MDVRETGIMGVRLKNEYQSPIGGWQFVDAPINDEPITVWGLDELIQNVIFRRKLNPRFGLSLDEKTVRAEALTQNALRMTSIRGGEHYLIQDDTVPGPAPGSQGFPPLQHARRSAVGVKARSIATGVGILLDWLGEGGQPVDLPLAETRAKVCVGCPQNQKGDWLALFTEPVANKIRQQVSIKNEMELKTSVDDELKVCKACLCPLPLKVFVPIEQILKHTSEETKAKLDPRCWILAGK